MENFERLVNRISVEPLYEPNETDLQITALNAFATQLRTVNRNVINAYTDMKNANRALNSLLFSTNGICDSAMAIKAYIRSVFGRGSTQHKEIAQLEFSRK